jgi:PIN domain nuclease of toxin-antitoxin system
MPLALGMNEVLLDTHALLWFDLAPEKLSSNVRLLIQEPERTVFVSSITAWEIGIKFQLGKLPEAKRFLQQFHQKLAQYSFIELAFSAADALAAARLKLTHKDPFDRALAAQALSRRIPIVSVDSNLDVFGVERIW